MDTPETESSGIAPLFGNNGKKKKKQKETNPHPRSC